MFSSRLKQLRKNASLTQIEFAKKFNIANGTVGNWESGKRQPDQEMLKKIADFFDVSVDYLLGRAEKGTNTETEEYLELLRTRPEMKMLFNTTKNATKEEIQTILDNNNGMLGFLAKFLLFTGLRLGEALALSYADIDIENRLIHVNKSLYYMGNIPHIKTPKTTSGIRSVFILDPILSDLKPNAAPTELLFPDENGGYLPKHKYVKPWNRWMKQMGIYVTAHQLRHAYASYILYDAKIDVKTAQKLLGHADTSTTMDIYTHVTESRCNEGFKQINKHVAKMW